jgi:hypothetical protein
MRVHRTLVGLMAAAAFAATIATGTAFAGTSTAAAVGSSQGHSLRYLGTTNVRQLAAQARPAPASSDTRASGGLSARRNLSPKASSATSSSSGVANPRGLPLTKAPAGASPYDGLSAADERLANGGNNYTYVPPDGGFCRGGEGVSVQTVNGAFGFFGPNMILFFAPLTQNQFWGLPPAIDRVNGGFPGPSMGDAKCNYDPGTGRMMLLSWATGQDPTTGDFTGTNDYYIAVSASSDVLGSYYLFDLPLDPPDSNGCHPACLSDHPTLSTDANIVESSYNKYNAVSGAFEGARLIVMSKAALTAGVGTIAYIYDAGKAGGGRLYTLQGANAPGDGTYDTSNGGTMWFLSALQFVPGVSDSRVAIEALENTSAIDSDPSAIIYDKRIVSGVNHYLNPPVTPQLDGEHPLGSAFGEPLNYLDSGGDEMQPIWYAGGQLWGILDTKVGLGSTLRGGTLWMTVQPGHGPAGIIGTVTHQQFVSVTTNWLDYGAIAVNGAGTAAIVTASMAGPTVFPSSVYGILDTSTWKVSGVTVYLNGVRPIDDFDCYPEFNPDYARGCRFGDYNAAVVGPAGDAFVLETEYVTAKARVTFANWGTGLAVVDII